MRCNIDSWTPEERVLACLVRDLPLAEPLAGCRQDELERLAIRHCVLAPLSARVEAETRLSPVWRLWAATTSLSAERDASCRVKAASKAISLLEDSGVFPIVLKGPSLSLGNPRDSGDVDLLIPEESLRGAIAVLEGAGYMYVGFDRNGYIRNDEYRDWDRLSRWSIQFEFAEPDTGVLVELHTAFFETERVYSEDLAPLRERIGEFVAASAVDPQTGYRFLSMEDRALLIALHAGIKRSPANRNFVLRHLLDLKTLVLAGLDWDILIQRAERFGVSHHLLLLVSLYEAIAGDLIPDAIPRRIESRLSPAMARLVRLHCRCFVDLLSFPYCTTLVYRFVSPFVLRCGIGAKARAILILPLLFPPPYRMAELYSLPRRSAGAILLYPFEPFRWLRLLFLKAVAKSRSE